MYISLLGVKYTRMLVAKYPGISEMYYSIFPDTKKRSLFQWHNKSEKFLTSKYLSKSLRKFSHISLLIGHVSRVAICDLMSACHTGSVMISISSSRAPDSSPQRAVNAGSSSVAVTVWAIWLRTDRMVTTGPTAWPILWRSWVVSEVPVMPGIGLYLWLHTGRVHGVGELLYIVLHSVGLITLFPSGSPVHWQQRCVSMWWKSLCCCFDRYSSKPFCATSLSIMCSSNPLMFKPVAMEVFVIAPITWVVVIFPVIFVNKKEAKEMSHTSTSIPGRALKTSGHPLTSCPEWAWVAGRLAEISVNSVCHCLSNKTRLNLLLHIQHLAVAPCQ